MNKIYVILFLSFICVNICGASTGSSKALIKKLKNIKKQAKTKKQEKKKKKKTKKKEKNKKKKKTKK